MIHSTSTAGSPATPHMATRDIPLARPNISQAEIDAVVAVLRTPNLSLGPKVPEFEDAVAQYCGTRHGIACSSGTTGLHLLMHALGIGPGDEVITSPFSFVASANCILIVGATPVFVDIDPATWCMDPSRLESAITPRTKAVIPVDVFGRIADMSTIVSIARRHRLRVVEDSCEALGAESGGRRAGAFGDAGVFGFYPNKQITTGEGGMIVTDSDEVAALCRSLRNQGRDAGGGWLAHPRLGYNYRLSDIQCALGLAQLARIDEILADRARVADLYLRRLRGERRVVVQALDPKARMSWFVFVVRLADAYSPKDRDRVLAALRKRGIGCSNYFVPIHLQPFYRERFGFAEGDFPICEHVAERTVALPFHHEVSEGDVDRVCTELLGLL